MEYVGIDCITPAGGVKPAEEMSMNSWKPIATAPVGVTVRTKIDDESGCRNEADLKKLGPLWWHADGSMYVYYTPTHWREIEATR